MPAVQQNFGENKGIRDDTASDNEATIGADAGSGGVEDSMPDVTSSNLPLSKSKHIIAFDDDDPGNPYNWSSLRKAWVVLIGILAVLNSTVGSSIPSGAIPQLADHFHIEVQEQLVLPNSIYLAGYVLGPLVFGPLSETYGRRIVMLSTFAGYTIFTLAACFAPDFATFVVFRLFQGIFASSPISVTGGVYADLYGEPKTRGRAMAIFMTATSLGPLAAPIISGYLGPFGWRWPYWVQLMMTGTTWMAMVFHPETYGPTILQKRARKIRHEWPDCNVVAPIELEPRGFRTIVTVVLTRPIRMFFTEGIVLSICVYLAFIYAIQYLFFQVYPIIYPNIYNFTEGEEGLAFIPIALGSICSGMIYLWWEQYLRRAQARGTAWALREDYRRVPLACIGGPLIPLGMFWIGWTARPDIHWIVPVLGGLWFGTGYLVIFMSLINYLIDAYDIFAASAIAAASCSRSIFGTVLPFAATPLFDELGIAWACSLLGFLCLAMCAVPFVFLLFGDKLRDRSKFCRMLKQQKTESAQEKQVSRAHEGRRSTSAQPNIAGVGNKEVV